MYFGGNFHPVHSVTPSKTVTTTITPLPTRTPTGIWTSPDATLTLTPSITPTPSITSTLSNTPPTPTNPANLAPKINFFTTDTPTLTWTRVSWATGYQIQISMDKTFPPASTFNTTLPPQPLAYTTGNLANGTYYWRLMALGGTVSTWSSTDTFVISIPPTPEITP